MNEAKVDKMLNWGIFLLLMLEIISVANFLVCKEPEIEITLPKNRSGSPQIDLNTKQVQNHDEILWSAVCWQESRFNARAYNADEDAIGIAQIRPDVIADINALFGLKIVHNDAYDPNVSRETFHTYTKGWCDRLKLEGSIEQRVRIWQGGPYGNEKNSTLAYWNRIDKFINENKFKQTAYFP